MPLRVVCLATLLAVSPALAFDTGKLGQFGSLPLSDIMPLIGKTAALQREVKSALSEAKKSADAVMCDGARFPGSWVNLGGEHVAPYTCAFGGKWLVINSDVRITGRNGQVFETVSPTAMKLATKVSETNLTWQWTTQDPDKDK